jgi:hypothetical protein
MQVSGYMFPVNLELEEDALFLPLTSTWGWATWKSRWEICDPTHMFLENEQVCKNLLESANNKYEMKKFLQLCKRHREQTLRTGKVASYESPLRATRLLNNMLSIVPNKNQIKNLGLSIEAEHTPSSIEYVAKSVRQIYLIDAMEMEFPLKHPKWVFNNVEFYHYRCKLLGRDNPIRPWLRRLESVIRTMIVDFRKRHDKKGRKC